MNPDILEKVLACPRLPSLPAIAVRIVELVQDADVSVSDLADTIGNDQALAAKVLRTVNSSFYGLRNPCSTINQAIVMLGLSAVKTLALGFSLVGSAAKSIPEGFDYVSYWRRGLYTGIAARFIAKAAGAGREEECFLGGLLQDVGMIALHQALGSPYGKVLAQTEGDHRKLVGLEIAQLETQHPDIGSLLARRWKLPEELVMPIKYHERPTAAPAEHLGIARAVGLGNIASDVLTAAEPAGPLTRFYARAEQWFGLTAEASDKILKQIAQAARETAQLFQLDIGAGPDAGAILAQAHQRLLSMTITEEPEPPEPAREGEPAQPTHPTTDPLTGLPSRYRFDQAMIANFEQSCAGGGPLSLALFDIDGLATINTVHSRQTGDATIAAVGTRLRGAFGPAGATVYAYGPGRFGALLPRTDRAAATRAAEQARRRIHASPLALPPGEAAVTSLNVSVSVGLTCMDAAKGSRFADSAEMLRLTEQALMAAKGAGRNTLRVYAPAAAAA